MLTTMRERTKYIMFILAIAFVGWLVFDVGMGVTGRNQNQGGQNAGKVNGTPIRYQAWMEAERQASEQWRQQNPGANQSREEQPDKVGGLIVQIVSKTKENEQDNEFP